MCTPFYLLATLAWQSLANPSVVERTSRFSGKVRLAKLGNHSGSPYPIFTFCHHSTPTLSCFTLLSNTLATLARLPYLCRLLHSTAHLSISIGLVISYGLHTIETNKKAVYRTLHTIDRNSASAKVLLLTSSSVMGRTIGPWKHLMHARNCCESEQKHTRTHRAEKIFKRPDLW